jgi:hypothetical protein
MGNYRHQDLSFVEMTNCKPKMKDAKHYLEDSVWQRRFREHLIRDENGWHRHMDCIHYNPAKSYDGFWWMRQ